MNSLGVGYRPSQATHLYRPRLTKKDHQTLREIRRERIRMEQDRVEREQRELGVITKHNIKKWVALYGCCWIKVYQRGKAWFWYEKGHRHEKRGPHRTRQACIKHAARFFRHRQLNLFPMEG